MKSEDYRQAIRRIVKKSVKKKFPGLNGIALNEAARIAAIAIHARFYGANVDGVESPLWRKDEPEIDAKELLKCDG